MSKCPTMRAFTGEGRVTNVYCGQWSCKRCSKIKARLWAWRVRITIQQSEATWYFWTLTMRRKYRTATQAYDALPRLWDTLRKRIQRRKGNFSYVAFVEGQPKNKNMPHFHIITNVKPWKRVKDIAHEAGFGFIAHCAEVNSGHAASYVAKYATKQNPDTPKGFRRVRASRDIEQLPEYDAQILIVPYRTEHEWEYILRVHNITGIDADDLLDRWNDS